MNKQERIKHLRNRIRACEQMIATLKRERHLGKTKRAIQIEQKIAKDAIPGWEQTMKKFQAELSKLTSPKRKAPVRKKKKKITRRR